MRVKFYLRREEIQRLEKWHKWFAWYPVRAYENSFLTPKEWCWCWMEIILRKGEFHQYGKGYYPWWTWQYFVNEPNIERHLVGECKKRFTLPVDHSMEECR